MCEHKSLVHIAMLKPRGLPIILFYIFCCIMIFFHGRILLCLQVKEGDIVDRVVADKINAEHFTLGRVRLLEILETTKKGNYKVKLRRTRTLVVPKLQYEKSLACEEELKHG